MACAVQEVVVVQYTLLRFKLQYKCCGVKSCTSLVGQCSTWQHLRGTEALCVAFLKGDLAFGITLWHWLQCTN